MKHTICTITYIYIYIIIFIDILHNTLFKYSKLLNAANETAPDVDI